MYIKKIVKYYEDELEADVIVTDGSYELLCYALSCENQVGDTDFSLSPFGCSDVITSDEKKYKITKLKDGYFSYKLQGKLIDINERYEGIMQIGSIVICEISGIPKDINVGEYIEFTVVRLDI